MANVYMLWYKPEKHSLATLSLTLTMSQAVKTTYLPFLENSISYQKYSQTWLLRTAWDRPNLFVITGVRYNRVTDLASYSIEIFFKGCLSRNVVLFDSVLKL